MYVCMYDVEEESVVCMCECIFMYVYVINVCVYSCVHSVPVRQVYVRAYIYECVCVCVFVRFMIC